jgi:hypothetical protein
MADAQEDHAPQIVATAGSGPEAEMICQILAGAGILAMQRRLIDNPEFGPSGPRSVLVKAPDLARAREALGLEPTQQTHPNGIDPKTGESSEPAKIPVPKRGVFHRLLHRALGARNRVGLTSWKASGSVPFASSRSTFTKQLSSSATTTHTGPCLPLKAGNPPPRACTTDAAPR